MLKTIISHALLSEKKITIRIQEEVKKELELTSITVGFQANSNLAKKPKIIIMLLGSMTTTPTKKFWVLTPSKPLSISTPLIGTNILRVSMEVTEKEVTLLRVSKVAMFH